MMRRGDFVYSSISLAVGKGVTRREEVRKEGREGREEGREEERTFVLFWPLTDWARPTI